MQKYKMVFLVISFFVFSKNLKKLKEKFVAINSNKLLG